MDSSEDDFDADEADEAYFADDDRSQWRGGSDSGSGSGGAAPPRAGWLDGFGWQGGGVMTALVSGAFVLGIGAGVAGDTVVQLDRDNVATQVMFDRATPNADACAAYGASAVVFDQRIFLSFNPFNVYVSQPEMKPGCVLRRSNWSVLENRNLLPREAAEDCKQHLNTFAFVGDLQGRPEVSCVYHSEQAENAFLRDPSSAVLGDGFAGQKGSEAGPIRPGRSGRLLD